jgi:hypothetical protein
MTTALAILAFVSLGLFYRSWRQRQAILSLNWTGRLGYYRFRATLVRFLRYNGWQANSPTATYPDIFAVKNNKRIRIKPLPEMVHVSRLKLKDFHHFTGSKDDWFRVCVAANDLSWDARDEAKRQQVALICYKDLPDMIRSDDMHKFFALLHARHHN